MGEVSAPARTDQGFHIVELVSRKVTRLEDVATQLRAELRRGSAKPMEVLALRKELLQKYGFRPERKPR